MKNAISGSLMSQDNIIATISNSNIIPHIDNLLPLYFQQEGATLDGWLKMRSIDTGRVNSRLIRKSLGLSDASAEELVLSVNAAMITDTYWVKPEGSNLTWKQVRFDQNNYASMSLLGSFSDFSKTSERTPELTSPGSFEKCWKLEDMNWWLYKLSDLENLYSELVAFRLCKHFGYSTAHYEKADVQKHGFVGKLKEGRGVIRTLDFTNNAAVNFEPAAALGLRSDDYNYNYQTLNKISPQLAEEYLNIVTMDTLVYNLDRHTQNFGVLRDVKSGEIISLAPNFDNNLSLLAGIHGMKERSINDRLFQSWKQLIQGNLLAITIPPLDEESLHSILFDKTDFIDDNEKTLGYNFILHSYTMMNEVSLQKGKFHGLNS